MSLNKSVLSDTCNICLKVDHTLSINEEIYRNNEIIRIKQKLQNIAPEVEWLDAYRICEQCINVLILASNFREQCLKLTNQLLKQENDLHYFSDSLEDKFNHENDSDTSLNVNPIDAKEKLCELFICYHCNKECKAKSDLIQHIKEVHTAGNDIKIENKYKRKEMCPKCGRRFASVTSLEEHESLCDGIRRHSKIKAEYQCDKCGKYYTTLKILKAHKLKCSSENLIKTDFQCAKCNKYYKNARMLQIHYKSGCKQDRTILALTCRICNEPVKTSLELEKHFAAIHKTSNTFCGSCKLNFKTAEGYDMHRKTVHKLNVLKRFICEVCDQEFGILKEIMDHCVSIHSMQKNSIRPYSCDICNRRFRTSTNLFNHRLYHDGHRTNVCSICGKSFITKNDLIAHEQTHFNFRKYKCGQCDKAFKTNTNLRTHHLIVHTDPALWKYTCRVCSKRFPQKSNHDQHLRRHLGEKNFECSLCKKLFTSKREVQDHVLGHSNVRNYRCQHCGKEYRKKYTYNVHLAKIHGIGNVTIRVCEKKYACHICPWKFYDKQKLTRHLYTHSGVKPYSCSTCAKKFTDKSYLKHHLKTVHSTENADV